MNLPVSEAARRVGVAPDDLWCALASYVRSILSGNAPYDRFVNGERDALSSKELAKQLLLEIRENRTDSWRINKTQLLLGDLYRHLLGKPAPGIKELASTPNEVSPEDAARSVRIVVPAGTLTITAPPIVPTTQVFPPSVKQDPPLAGGNIERGEHGPPSG